MDDDWSAGGCATGTGRRTRTSRPGPHGPDTEFEIERSAGRFPGVHWLIPGDSLCEVQHQTRNKFPLSWTHNQSCRNWKQYGGIHWNSGYCHKFTGPLQGLHVHLIATEKSGAFFVGLQNIYIIMLNMIYLWSVKTLFGHLLMLAFENLNQKEYPLIALLHLDCWYYIGWTSNWIKQFNVTLWQINFFLVLTRSSSQYLHGNCVSMCGFRATFKGNGFTKW